ncbi:S1/P1 nuclease [Mucilaginibacter sp. HMF5004]|uniref:S1/P1 nuclease n=1 Tax=Mucilaginibacter rivuli TaxID=2857527 RepID=UPI001C5F1713|nr:S1/P1 nuclease [Mucilaginibacter rivuli]MBW4890625.1 S1/P1 nuclease [Mucilaginibacter rivuli]
MKKSFLVPVLLVLALVLQSWGIIGHRTVAKIAENHLTSKAKEEIAKLLGNESLPDVANWADEIRSDQRYNFTAPWHYVNLPGGLTFEQFKQAVITMPGDNIFKVIVDCERTLTSDKKSKVQKAMALKYLVHFIGDLHQPMHISHAEDKGGNSIDINFFNVSGNLHNLWDSALIEHAKNNDYSKLAQAYDTATPEQINKWQADDIMIWLWESYQISSILYEEVKDNKELGEDYYQEHIAILQKQIDKGGIRLAGQLNAIFK